MTITESLIYVRTQLQSWVTTNIRSILNSLEATNTKVNKIEKDLKGKVNASSLRNIATSAEYSDLKNAPTISLDKESELLCADQDGYIILRVDADGLHTTQIFINNKSLDTIIEEKIAAAQNK